MQDKRAILAHYGLKNDDFVFDFSDGILKPHNQAIYKKIVKAYDSSNRVLIEQATGTGKSFLAMKLIKDYALNQDKKVLFVCPTEIIQDAFVGNCEEFLHTSEVDTCLYQGLHNYADKHYDLIIFDEAHRLGATVWGANAKTLIENNPEAKILGMSATLERQDGKRVDEILGVRGPVSRLTLPDAIQRNILPSPNYTLVKVNFDDDWEFLDTSEKDLKERLKEAKKAKDNYTKGKILNLLTDIQEAKNRISECEQIPDILQKTLNTEHLKNGKFIVFCPLGADDDSEIDALKMEQIMQDAPKWFAGINAVTTYGVHSKYGTEHNLAEIKRFEEDNSDNVKLLFAVNMLNEGKHVKGIDGVLMFRKTSSNIIYLQQLGRVLSVVDTEEQPIVLDFVANLNYQAISDIKECLGSTGDTEQGDNENTPTSTDEYKEKDFTREFTLNIENLSTVDFIERLKENVYDLFDDEFFNEVMNKSLQFIKENGKDELLRSTKNTIMQDVEGNKYKLGAKWYYLLQSKLDGSLIFTKEQQQLFDKVMAEDEDLQKAGIEITAKEVIDNMFKHDWLMEDLIKYSKQYIVEFGKGEFLKTIHSTVIQDVTGNKYPLGKKWYQLITKDNFTEVRQDLFNKLIAEDEELQKAGIEVTAQEVIDNMFKRDWNMEDLIEYSKQYIREFGKEEFLRLASNTTIQDANGNKYGLGIKWYGMLITNVTFTEDRQELFNKLMAEDERLQEAGIEITAQEVIDNMFKHDWLMEDIIKYSKQYLAEFGREEFLRLNRGKTIQDITGNKYALGKQWYRILVGRPAFTETRQGLFNKLIAEDEELQKAGIEITAKEVIENMFKRDWLMEDIIKYSKQYVVEFGKEEFLRLTQGKIIQDNAGNKYALGQKWYQMLVDCPTFTADRQELFNKLIAEDEDLQKAGIEITAKEVIENMFKRDWLMEDIIKYSKQYVVEFGKEEFLRLTQGKIIQDNAGNKYALGQKWYQMLVGRPAFTETRQGLFNKLIEEDEDLQKAGIEVTAQEVIDNMFKRDWNMEDLIEYSKQYIREFGKEEFLRLASYTTIQDANGKKYGLGIKWYGMLITNVTFTEDRQEFFNKLMAEDEDLQKAGIEVTAQEIIDNMFKHDWLMEELIEYSKQYIVEFGKDGFLRLANKKIIQDTAGNKYALGQKWYQMLISYPAFNKDRQELFNKLMAEDEKLIEAGITIDANEVIDNMFGGNGFANRISLDNPSQMGDGEE